MQADRDFAVATHARGIDGWMSFYAPDAIRIRYRGDMVKGFDEVRRFDLPNISDTTTALNWEPTDAYVFRGGTIGSTTGRYSVVSRRAADAGKALGTRSVRYDVATRCRTLARDHGHRLSRSVAEHEFHHKPAANGRPANSPKPVVISGS
jgi:ketosteroid isomerase-like protein